VYLAEGGSGWWMLSLLFSQPMLKLTSDKTRGLMLHWKPFNPPDVEELERLVASGAVKPAIDRRFPLDQVVDALTYVHEGRAPGKISVIRPMSPTNE
jgi:NADPH:quinone reductase-like Zn-dependent oxidoreductase